MGIQAAYRNQIAVTLSELSSNIVNRSENGVNRFQRHRMTLRKQLFELHPSDHQAGGRVLDKGIINGWIDVAAQGQPAEMSAKIEGLRRFLLEKLAAELGQNSAGEKSASDRTSNSLQIQSGQQLRKFCWQALRDAGLTCDDVARRLLLILDWHCQSPLHCRSTSNRQFSRYLGFIDFRTHSPQSPISLALLVPPRDLRHDRQATIIQGHYGRLFGSHSFLSTVYAMHDERTGGAYCAQASVIMVATILSDRQAKVLGSFDLSFLAIPEPEPAEFDAEKVAQLRSAGITRIFPIRGLTIEETRNLLCGEAIGVRAQDVAFFPNRTWRRVLKRLIDAYVSARCPVILYVDGVSWFKRSGVAHHAVVIVGVRRSIASAPDYGATVRDEVTELIVHDPGKRPFWVRPVDECLTAASARGASPDSDQKSSPAPIQVVFSLDASIRPKECDVRHADLCINYICNNLGDDWCKYFVVPGNDDRESFAKTYAAVHLQISHDTDYEVRLLQLHDLERLFGFPNASADEVSRWLKEIPEHVSEDTKTKLAIAHRIQAAILDLDREWYWCIAGFRGLVAEKLWLFSTRSGNDHDAPKAIINLISP